VKQEFIDVTRLLLDITPAVFQSPRFAMKGGTALNLFVQDMPRLSVDIDIVFTDHTLEREAALEAIAADLRTVKAAVTAKGYRAVILSTKEGDEVTLLVSSQSARVKVEVNFVFRGTVLPVTQMPLAQAAQDLFTTNVVVPVLDVAELYGGKLVAAMDRQHPRDLFDVMLMLQRYGWRASFIDCFVVYLAGHNRPVHEVLFPKTRPLEAIFADEFAGLTQADVAVDALEETQAQMFVDLPRALTASHRAFLLSLVRGEPAWNLMPYAHLQDLPALKWKLVNLHKLKTRNTARFQAQHDELAARF
jgi:hypothetical protein